MKKTLLCLVAISLVGCAATDPLQAERDRQSAIVKQVLAQTPAWVDKPPRDGLSIYAVGTAADQDWNVADYTAKAVAYGRLCMQATGSVSQRTNVDKKEVDRKLWESTDIVLKTQCQNININDVQILETKHVAEGHKIRTFILVELPRDSIKKH
jgi:hypothetical protein